MREGHQIQAKLTDAELIRRCQSGSGHPPPWDLFFKRFLYHIDKRIIKSLLSLGAPNNPDLVYSIRAGIEERLFRDRILDKLDNVANFKSWMGRVVQNHVVDWARQTSRFRDAAERLDKGNTGSLSDPVSPNDNRPMEEVLGDENEALGNENLNQSELQAQVASVLKSMEDLADRYRYVIRASIMFYDPLSADDLEMIAGHREVSANQVREEADLLMKDMQRRHEKAAREKITAFNLHAQILRLESRLNELRRDPQADPKQKEHLKREIGKKSERRKRLLDKNLRPIRPATRQLASFLGIPEANVATINTLLHRARKMLIAKRMDVTNRHFSRLC